MFSDIKLLFRTILEAPEVASIFVVLVIATLVVTSYTGLKRREIESLAASNLGLTVLGFLLVLVPITLQVIAMFFLPITVLVSVIRIVAFDLGWSASSLLTAGLAPGSKLAIVMGLGWCLGDVLNADDQFTARRYFLSFLVLLLPVYYSVLGMAWLVAKILRQPAGSVSVELSLFAPPAVASGAIVNAAIVAGLTGLIAVTFFRMWKGGVPWPT